MLAAGTVRADAVTLKDGTVREGKIVKEDEGGVVMEVVFGTLRGRVRIPRSEIASSYVPSPSSSSTFRSVR